MNQLNDKLFKALFNEDVEEIEKLIQQGADIEATDGNGMTLMHYAARLGHVFIVKTLIMNGASVLSETNRGTLPSELSKTEEVYNFLTTQERKERGVD